MRRHIDQDEFHEFYQRWKATVFTFCRLHTGNPRLAAAATQDAFLAYVTDGRPLDAERLPLRLLWHARDASLKWEMTTTEYFPRGEFESLLVSLPEDQRTIFILHSILGLAFPWVAAVSGIASEEATRLWISALLRFREEMPGLRTGHVLHQQSPERGVLARAG